jgi:hypothetical protein
MHIKNTQTTTIKHNNQTKQSLVHKFPSGVAILSHVCGVTTIVHYLRKKNGNGVFLANMKRQEILVSYQ